MLCAFCCLLRHIINISASAKAKYLINKRYGGEENHSDKERHTRIVVKSHPYQHANQERHGQIVRPREQRQAERDGRRIEREQFVFEPELRLSGS